TRGNLALLVGDRAQPECGSQEAGGRLAVAADLDVVEHAHLVEQRHVLEGATHADRRNRVPRHRQNGPALEQDLAARRYVEATEAVEKRGLAGPVRPDEAYDLPCRHV